MHKSETRAIRRAMRRRSVVALAVVSLAASTQAATDTWVGGHGGDPTNYNDPLNWSTGTIPGSGDVAFFNIGQANQPTLTGSASVGEVDFNTSGWMLAGGPNVLSLSGVGGIGILSTPTSATNEISAYLDVFAAQTWEVGTGGTLQIDGVISDSNALTLGATGFAGTTILTANNTFSGTLTLAAGTLELAGSTINGTPQTGTLQSVNAITLNSGSTLLVNNTTAAGGNANNRINNAGSFQLWGGNFVYDGADAASTNSSGAVSSTTINAGAISTITVNPAGGNGASFNLGSLQRGANAGVLFVNGANLGTTPGQVFVNSPPTTVGTNPDSGAIQPGVDNIQIVPFMLGESGTASGAGGTATGTPNTFVTVYPTGGVYAFRPLNPTDEFTNNSIVSGNNTYVTQATTASSTNAINSLVINGGDLSISDGATLTNTSGATLFVTSNSIKPSGTTGTLDFSANEGLITVNNGVTANISAPITSGSNGVTENGGGVLALTTANSNVSGSLSINGTVQFGNGTSAAADAMISNAATNVNIDQNGILNFDDVTAQTVTFPINFFNNNLTEGATYGVGTLLISGPGAVNFNNVITRQNAGFAYIESQSLAPVTFSGSFNVTNMRFYESGTNEAGTPIGSYASPVTWNVSNGGSIGTSANTALTLYWSNNNFGTGVTPSPVVMNVTNTGSIYAQNLYLGYNGGALTTNVNGPVTLTTALFGAYNPNVTNNNSTVYSTLNVGAGGNVTTPSAYLAYSTGQFQYFGVNNGGQFNVINTTTPNSTNFYAANTGDTVMELGTLNGSTASTGTVNIGANSTGSATQNIIFNGGTPRAANEFSELNLYAGGTLNIGNQSGGSFGSTGAPGLNAGYATGQTFVLNVYGGTLSNMIGNAPVFVGQSIAAGWTAYSVVNLDSDANGNVGKLNTGYLRALPNPTNASTTAVGDTSAFLNFNGGELEFNNVNNTTGATTGNVTQSSFPNNGYDGGIFVFSKGAVFGTNGLEATLGSSIPGGIVAPSHPFMAPLGNGVITIPVSNGGAGYLSPPAVQITDGTGDTSGVDATAVAVLTNGVVTAITITSPGINYAAPPTITLIGGDPTIPATIGTATIAANATTGGLTKVDNGTLTLTGGDWYPHPGQTTGPYVADDTAAQNTYGGPTTVVAGKLALNGTYNATNSVIIETNTAADAATLQISQVTSLNGVTLTQVNNNIPSAATIVVGDVPASTSLPNVGTFQISATGKNGVSGFALNASQVLAGFGNVQGTSTYGLNLGQAPSGATSGAITSLANPNPATPTALTGTDSVVAPGYTVSGSALVLLSNTSQYQPNSPYGPIVVGSSGGGTLTVSFSTKKGNAVSLSAPAATGVLTLGNGTSMTTTLGGAGTYYWKLDLSNASAGATTTPGTATVSPGLTAGAPAAGTAWDEVLLDTLSVNSTISASTSTGTSNAFTIQATDFSSNGTNSFSNGSSYSWVIARVNQAYNAGSAQQVLASLSLDTSGLPAAASGYQYFLSSQADPGNSIGAMDLVVNYAPVPEPAGLTLLGLGAGAMMIRRRRSRPLGAMV